MKLLLSFLLVITGFVTMAQAPDQSIGTPSNRVVVRNKLGISNVPVSTTGGDILVITPDGTVMKVTGVGGDYTPQGPTMVTVGGIPAGTDLGTTPVTMQSILDMMLYPYVGPGVTLATDNEGYFEIGSSIASSTLGISVTKRSKPITSVLLKRNGSTIYTVSSPSTESSTYSYIDNVAVTSNTTYQAYAGDVTSVSSSNNRTLTFVYAYYSGVGAKALTSSQIALLSKEIIPSTSSKPVTTSPVNQVYYFAYPASYGTLRSILDVNGFETLSDYTLRVENITNSYGQTTSYNIYEFKNLTNQTNFINTYKL